MNDSAKQIAGSLLQIKAIKLNPTNHFTWASGWYSPIYCDNRKILSYPAVRKQVYEAFAALIAEKYPQAEVLAGVATGAIAHGALVAEKMGKPFIYVRSAPKSHGLTNQVEGEVKPGAKVVVIEDLISTGGSCIEVVTALREAGAEVLGVASIFTYGMKKGLDRMKEANVVNYSLSNLDALVEVAAEEGYIKPEDKARLLKFRDNPSDESWMEK